MTIFPRILLFIFIGICLIRAYFNFLALKITNVITMLGSSLTFLFCLMVERQAHEELSHSASSLPNTNT